MLMFFVIMGSMRTTLKVFVVLVLMFSMIMAIMVFVFVLAVIVMFVVMMLVVVMFMVMMLVIMVSVIMMCVVVMCVVVIVVMIVIVISMQGTLLASDVRMTSFSRVQYPDLNYVEDECTDSGGQHNFTSNLRWVVKA